jgi:hypothetical protein
LLTDNREILEDVLKIAIGIVVVKYCDMTPESRNSEMGARRPLPGNGSVNTA